MFKNILFGLGSAGVVAGGGYMIYNATRSLDDKEEITFEKEKGSDQDKVNSNADGDDQEQESQSKNEDDSAKNTSSP